MLIRATLDFADNGSGSPMLDWRVTGRMQSGER